MNYTIDWVGDRFRDWGDDRRTWTISVKDQNGNEIRKVKWDRGQNDPAPQVGDTIEGSVDPHPRFDDAKIFNAGASAPSTSSAPAQAGTGGDRSRSIERQVAAKTAGVIVSAMIGAKMVDSPQAVAAEIKAMTETVVAAIDGKTEAPKTEAPKAETGGVDDDIPF